MTEAEKWVDLMNNGETRYDAPGAETKGTFTATMVDGSTIEIREKKPVGDAIVLVSVEGRELVPHPDNPQYVVDFDPELHVGGTTATGEAGAKMGPSADATEAAEARAALDNAVMQDGVDATEAAEAKAALEGEIAQSPTAIPPGEEEKPPPAVEPAEEPAAAPDPVMGGAAGPLPGGVEEPTEEAPPSES